jgi:hypothetical protein
MNDINPLGPMLHLKQLEQKVSTKLGAVRRRRNFTSIADLGLAIAAHVRGLVSQLPYPVIQVTWARRQTLDQSP